MAKGNGNFIQKATARMKRKGTVGAFGKATPKKIAAAKKEGGLEKKRAVFAENMKHIAEKRQREGRTKPTSAHKSRAMKHSPHNAVGAHGGYNL